MNPPYVSQKNLILFSDILTGSDRALRSVIDQFGYPPLWKRNPGFATLVHIILEQQVSLASAAAAFQKLNNNITELNPVSFLEFSDIELKSFGFSRQKTRYCRILANAVINKKIDLQQLRDLTDSQTRLELMKLTGIGRWTSDIYLLMALQRPDIWPRGDIALSSAYRMIMNSQKHCGWKDLALMAEKWKPYRSVAARILWHYYLQKKKI